MSDSLLSAMEFQLLVGLCCLHSSPDAVDITVGQPLYDPMTETLRDIDVTVITADPTGIRTGFAGYEVVNPGSRRPNINRVEGLMKKLLNIPDLNHRALVSSTGFTKAAVSEARKEGIELFEFRRWNPPNEIDLNLPGIRETTGYTATLNWTNLVVMPNPDSVDRTFIQGLAATDSIVMGGPPRLHLSSNKWTAVLGDVIRESLEGIRSKFPSPPPPMHFRDSRGHRGQPVGEAQNAEVLMDIDPPFRLCYGDDDILITGIQLSGTVQWFLEPLQTELLEMVNIHSDKPFAGAAIASVDDELLLTIVFSTTCHKLAVHNLRLSPRHRTMIQNLRLLASGSPSIC